VILPVAATVMMRPAMLTGFFVSRADLRLSRERDDAGGN